MIRIRPEQEQALLASLSSSFIADLAAYIHDVHPAIAGTSDDVRLRRRIASVLVRCRALGFTSQNAMASLIVSTLDLGPRFLDIEEVRALLAREGMSDEAKLAALRRLLSGWSVEALRRAAAGPWE